MRPDRTFINRFDESLRFQLLDWMHVGLVR